MLILGLGVASAQTTDSLFLVAAWKPNDTTLVVSGEFKDAANEAYMILISLEDDCDAPASSTPFFITIQTDSNGLATFTGSFAIEGGGDFVTSC